MTKKHTKDCACPTCQMFEAVGDALRPFSGKMPASAAVWALGAHIGRIAAQAELGGRVGAAASLALGAHNAMEGAYIAYLEHTLDAPCEPGQKVDLASLHPKGSA